MVLRSFFFAMGVYICGERRKIFLFEIKILNAFRFGWDLRNMKFIKKIIVGFFELKKFFSHPISGKVGNLKT